MAPYFSTLAWKISWTEEPGRLQSMGSRRVGQDWATSLSLFPFMHWEGNSNPPQCSCLENPRDGVAWWAAVYGVAQSWTRLKRLSSSSHKRGQKSYTWNFWTCTCAVHNLRLSERVKSKQRATCMVNDFNFFGHMVCRILVTWPGTDS